jgi:hypothetical protein
MFGAICAGEPFFALSAIANRSLLTCHSIEYFPHRHSVFAFAVPQGLPDRAPALPGALGQFRLFRPNKSEDGGHNRFESLINVQ